MEIQEIPVYMRPYIAKQDASLYTAMDHAVWRFILKISKSFFAKYAHQKYLDGLVQTGISSERIPLIEEMDECLRKFQWRAVAVSGFIPPAIFMEFLSLGVLPIACDMRQLNHIAYTPAPDIVHEAAGHAPILADPDYAEYLRNYGEISRKAIFSDQDMDIYFAIRALSEVKENPHSTPEEISAAQSKLDQAVASMTYDSEATWLSRMGWWTFEYGLIGTLEQPKIFGAGLLSSIGESYHCLGPGVKKIPFSLECIQTSYDITKPQPQLFVTPDFHTLKKGLEELASIMAFKMGGVEGLARAIKAKATTTAELETGIQISGCLKEIRLDSKGHPIFLKYVGPTQLSYKEQELEGHGVQIHPEGFSTPLALVTDEVLSQADLRPGKIGRLDFSSGISVQGRMTGLVKREGHPVLLSFEHCMMRLGDELLFHPDWGKFDLACGARVVSVFGGAADREKYLRDTGGFHQIPGVQKTNLTEQNKGLNDLYLEVRKLREAKQFSDREQKRLRAIHEELERKYPEDWLLRYELLELSQANQSKLGYEELINNRLKEIAARSPKEIEETILRGMETL